MSMTVDLNNKPFHFPFNALMKYVKINPSSLGRSLEFTSIKITFHLIYATEQFLNEVMALSLVSNFFFKYKVLRWCTHLYSCTLEPKINKLLTHALYRDTDF